MDWHSKRSPRRRDERIILQFDYDCFYAQVCENKNPSLKTQPLGIRQKGILATCNYVARGFGVTKLMGIPEAKRLCPELVLVDGMDLTPFRNVSKVLFTFLRSHSWNGRVERLGLDEVFVDFTDLVDYNLFCLNRNSMANYFFCLSKENPEAGFACDLTALAGCVQGRNAEELDLENPAHLRLLLGSHLAQYLRLKMEENFGYTSTCGISTNKLLSKLVGTKNKPRNQTTLLTLGDDDAVNFIDGYKLRAIPGLGFKIAQQLQNYVTSSDAESDSHSFDSKITAAEVRLHPAVSAARLESLLAGPGAEKGIGARVWSILHGIDASEVKEASDVPSQISIEDTYKGLETMAQIIEQLHKLALSLLRRIKVDLLAPVNPSDMSGPQRWVAKPKTIRLSVRSWPQPGSKQDMNYNRTSRSAQLPNFVFEQQQDPIEVVDRLVAEVLLPLLRRLQTDKTHRWNLQLINICVANMVAGAAEDGSGVGRDISVMFRLQNEACRLRGVESIPIPDSTEIIETTESDAFEDDSDGGDGGWPASDSHYCPVCGHAVLPFALQAHFRYHNMDD